MERADRRLSFLGLRLSVAVMPHKGSRRDLEVSLLYPVTSMFVVVQLGKVTADGLRKLQDDGYETTAKLRSAQARRWLVRRLETR
jgi:hypothetical protein